MKAMAYLWPFLDTSRIVAPSSGPYYAHIRKNDLCPIAYLGGGIHSLSWKPASAAMTLSTLALFNVATPKDDTGNRPLNEQFDGEVLVRV